jgi:hypothetical protein
MTVMTIDVYRSILWLSVDGLSGMRANIESSTMNPPDVSSSTIHDDLLLILKYYFD